MSGRGTGRRGQLAPVVAPSPIDNNKGKGKRNNNNNNNNNKVLERSCKFAYIHICTCKQLTLNPQKISVSSLYIPHDISSLTHVLAHLDTESEQGDASEEDTEQDWFGNIQDVEPGVQAPSKASKAMNDEVSM